MAALSTIIPIITAVASMAGSVIPALTQKKSSQPQLPAPQAPAVPNAVAPDKSAKELAGLRPGEVGSAPNFLKMSGSMTPLQQRSAIATYATSGNDSRYKDPATKKYYQDLTLSTLIDPSGKVTGSPTGIEKQFVTNVLGQDIRGDSTESFLSALLRA